MSASTVSITANQEHTARRRTVVKRQPTGVGSDADPTAVADSIAGRKSAGDTAAAVLMDARNTPAQTRKCDPPRKKKPHWLTGISIVTKNLALLLILLGFIQMIRWVVMNSGKDSEGLSLISGDVDGKLAEIERFVKSAMTGMQVQVATIDQQIEDRISLVWKEFDEKMEKKEEELDLKLKAIDVRTDAFEKFIDGFGTKSLLSKEEFSEFFEEFKNARKKGGIDGGEVRLDEIRDYAREVVEKEITRHAADGLGMVDYALASGGAGVVKHSEPYGVGTVVRIGTRLLNLNRIAPEAVKLITPSFGEPGHCFPLKGASGFVDISLRTAILPEAVTLEHVFQSVAYDRSSAPKDCRVSGWYQGQGPIDVDADVTKMFLLTEFTYDLEKSNAQTYKVSESAAFRLVDTIRFEFASNHGSASHTCIYRLRIHGREHSSARS